MKANELRIGNLIDCEFGISEVTYILDNGVLGLKCGSETVIEEVTPIELNEEWLKRMGLDSTIQFMDGVYPNSFLRLEFNEKDCCYYVTVGSDEYRIAKLQFVHEAQNFFALTGHELEIK